MTIKIEVKNVYGTLKAYPVCEHARTFAAMVGTKTLTRETLRHIQALGYTIESQANADWAGVS